VPADGAQRESVQQGNNADWFTRARDIRCAEPSKTRPPPYVSVTLPLLGASLSNGWRSRSADVEGSYEYIEYTVTDSRQGVMSQLGGRVRK
jgi:hypothetical protein